MIVYKDEAYKIMGAAFKVYNGLGHGFLEAVYQEALEIEFQKQGVPYEREKELKIYYKLGLLLNFGCADKLEYERNVL